MAPSKYFPPQPAAKDAEPITRGALERAGIVSTDPNAKRTKPTGSSPALRIACPVCKAPAGSYCMKTELLRFSGTSRKKQQTIAHKRRREEEERTR